MKQLLAVVVVLLLARDLTAAGDEEGKRRTPDKEEPKAALLQTKPSMLCRYEGGSVLKALEKDAGVVAWLRVRGPVKMDNISFLQVEVVYPTPDGKKPDQKRVTDALSKVKQRLTGERLPRLQDAEGRELHALAKEPELSADSVIYMWAWADDLQEPFTFQLPYGKIVLKKPETKK